MKTQYIIFGILLFGAGILIGKFVFIGDTAHVHTSPEIQEESADEWTCSMHPQIRQNEPGICPICEMDLIPVGSIGGSDDPRILQMTEESVRLAQIETIEVGDMQKVTGTEGGAQSIPVEGKVELDDRTILTQTAHVGGRIERMYINFEGEYVRSGQKIATVYSTDLLAASKELITAKKYEGKVPGVITSAKQKLKNWKLSDSQIQQVLDSEQAMSTIDLLAEHSGYVIAKFKTTGEYVGTGGSLFTVGNTGIVWVVFNVFESDLSHIKVGNRITFSTPSVPNETFDARVTYINPLLSASNTAEVRTEIRNHNQRLKPGMLVTGTIISNRISTDPNKSPIHIPKSAVLWTGPRSVVYILEPGYSVPTYRYREIEIEEAGSDSYRVLNGLKSGDQIVVHGAFVLDASAQLNQMSSMMNKDVSIKREEPESIPDYVEAAPVEFQDQVLQLTLAYMELKDALVQTDAPVAHEASDSMLKSLELVDMTLLSGEMHMYWMDRLGSLKVHIQKLYDEADIEAQRIQFDFISQEMIKTLRAFGTKDNNYYVQHCPMAFNNRGADWISAEKQIQNPYFGNKMMKCGVVKLELGED